MLAAPLNVNGRPNSDVVRPLATAVDLVQASRNLWTIDFGLNRFDKAVQYELPFEYVKKFILPIGRHAETIIVASGGSMLDRVQKCVRPSSANFDTWLRLATPSTASSSGSPKRYSVTTRPSSLPQTTTTSLVYSTLDSTNSGPYAWAIVRGAPTLYSHNHLRNLPLPVAPGREPAGDPRVEAIAQAARELVEQRDAWLNPPGVSEAELKKRS